MLMTASFAPRSGRRTRASGPVTTSTTRCSGLTATSTDSSEPSICPCSRCAVSVGLPPRSPRKTLNRSPLSRLARVSASSSRLSCTGVNGRPDRSGSVKTSAVEMRPDAVTTEPGGRSSRPE